VDETVLTNVPRTATVTIQLRINVGVTLCMMCGEKILHVISLTGINTLSQEEQRLTQGNVNINVTQGAPSTSGTR
jgi:hypothetical protein